MIQVKKYKMFKINNKFFLSPYKSDRLIISILELIFFLNFANFLNLEKNIEEEFNRFRKLDTIGGIKFF